MEADRMSPVHIVSLTGSAGLMNPELDTQRLAWKVAGLYQADVSLFHMPVYGAGEEDPRSIYETAGHKGGSEADGTDEGSAERSQCDLQPAEEQ